MPAKAMNHCVRAAVSCVWGLKCDSLIAHAVAVSMSTNTAARVGATYDTTLCGTDLSVSTTHLLAWNCVETDTGHKALLLSSMPGVSTGVPVRL
eukprot:COSAG02_NODE_122_length_35306_cov_98.280967_42_plen_94_part_00